MNAMLCASEFLEFPLPRPKPRVTVIDGSGGPKRKGLIDSWLDHLIRRYAGQKSAMWRGYSSDPHPHHFGWSGTSVLGKIKDEGSGAGQGSFRQHYAEGYTEDALLVRRALEGMAFDPYIVFHVYYLVSAPNKIKFAEAGYATSTAWVHLKEAHVWVERGVTLLEPQLKRREERV